eukprot:10765528-Prorocentrum_lima.AAC.1
MLRSLSRTRSIGDKVMLMDKLVNSNILKHIKGPWWLQRGVLKLIYLGFNLIQDHHGHMFHLGKVNLQTIGSRK